MTLHALSDSFVPTPTSAPAPDLEGWPHWSILVVDDEEGMRNFLLKVLAPRCRLVSSASSAEEAAAWVSQQHVDLIVLDITLPGQNGVAWLKELREQGYSGEVILMTAFADLDTAIESLRAGASDFLLKPFRVPQILNAIKQCHERVRLRRENYVLRRHVQPTVVSRSSLIGQSPCMQTLRVGIERMAPTTSTVLISGESGTGKELVARELHAQSARAQGPFVAVNCASLAADDIAKELFGHMMPSAKGVHHAKDGLFAYAQGGTLFLDEVAELPLHVQALLLRALEERQIQPVGGQQALPIDVRVIAATHRDLKHAVQYGAFRADLFYRLHVLDIRLPALRERPQDIALLVPYFIATMAPALGLPTVSVSPDEMQFLSQYHWPGNVRELRNWVERSLILGQVNVSALYPPMDQLQQAQPPSTAHVASTRLQSLEKQHMQAVLDSVGGDKTHAAKLLGVSRRTLERRVAEWAAALTPAQPSPHP